MNVERRRFLSRTVLGSATVVGTSALGCRPVWEAGRTGHRLPPKTADPGFTAGKVIGIHGSRLTVTNPDMLIQRIQISEGTDVWKLRHGVGLDGVEVGDMLYARGVVVPGGLFAACVVWVNIVNLHAFVTRKEPGRVHLAYSGGGLVGHVVRGTTEVVDRLGSTTADLSRLRVGSHVQVVGAGRPGGHEIDLSTILI